MRSTCQRTAHGADRRVPAVPQDLDENRADARPRPPTWRRSHPAAPLRWRGLTHLRKYTTLHPGPRSVPNPPKFKAFCGPGQVSSDRPNVPVCSDFLPNDRGHSLLGHAEGRGFESHQPLSWKPAPRAGFRLFGTDCRRPSAEGFSGRVRHRSPISPFRPDRAGLFGVAAEHPLERVKR